MNKQVSYISYAHLILAVVIGSYLLISRIPFQAGEQKDIIPSDSLNTQISTSIPANVAMGKNLFMVKCASCHYVSKEIVGPSLLYFDERGPWADRNKLYEWIRNPVAFMQKDPYTRDLKALYGTMMAAFPGLSNEEIDAIVAYINSQAAKAVTI
jgi:cytochrome c2